MAGFSLDTDGTSADANGASSGGTSASIGRPGQDSGIGGKTSGDAGEAGNGARDASEFAGEPGPKKRGRKPLPRDEHGNIIRDGSARATNAGVKAGMALNGFVPNNRAKVRQQIQGIHTAVSVITKQPVFMLSPPEAEALTNSLCDVLDYHEISLEKSGGPYGLYMTLIVTAFGIYKPRLSAIKNGGQAREKPIAKPSTPGEVMPAPKGMMDFSGDLH